VEGSATPLKIAGRMYNAILKIVKLLLRIFGNALLLSRSTFREILRRMNCLHRGHTLIGTRRSSRFGLALSSTSSAVRRLVHLGFGRRKFIAVEILKEIMQFICM
jgi:hypothetical protein